MMKLMQRARRDEDGAAMMFALLLIIVIVASISVFTMFVITDVRHENNAVQNTKQITSSDSAFSEALLTINSGDINSYVGETKKRDSNDGLSEWYLKSPSAGTYTVVVKNKKTGDNNERPVVSRPVAYIYPNTHNAGDGTDTMLYEPTLHGYYQWSFYGMRLADVENPDTSLYGAWNQTLTNSAIMSYRYSPTIQSSSIGPNPTASSGKGVWATSVIPGNVNDKYMESTNKLENLSNVTVNTEKFLGASDSAGKDTSSGYREDSDCPGCVRGVKKNYNYDLSFDQLDNFANNKCKDAVKRTWRSSTASTPGVLNPAENNGCWESMIFDRDTQIASAVNPIVSAKDIKVNAGIKVNFASDPRRIYLINYGTGGLTMDMGSSINGMVTSMGQKSCKLTGTTSQKVKIFGSLNCLNAYTINHAQLWWDTSIEDTYMTDTLSSRMWEYAE